MNDSNQRVQRTELINLIRTVDMETGLRLLFRNSELILGISQKKTENPLKLLPYWDALVRPKSKPERQRRWREFNHLMYRCQEGFLNWLEPIDTQLLISQLDVGPTDRS